METLELKNEKNKKGKKPQMNGKIQQRASIVDLIKQKKRPVNLKHGNANYPDRRAK